MFSKLPAFLLPVIALGFVPMQAQEPLNPAVPLVQAGPTTEAPGGSLRTLAAAQWAQELGLPSLAATLYRELLAAPAGSGGDRVQITLALVTALLDDGEIAGAEQALQTLPVSARGSAWHLRAGLIAAYQKKVEPAKVELAAVKREELVSADVGWWFFLQGMLANLANNAQSLEFYGQAAATARSGMARARFLLAQDQARLKLGTVTDNDVEEARKRAESDQGKTVGYAEARNYAMYLEVRGRKPQAIEVLQRALRSLPPDERDELDNVRLWLGLIAGAGEGVGRNALGQLLVSGTDAEKQRVALQLLSRASRDGPAKTDFRRQLGELIGAPKPHRILEDLLMVRAQVALEDANYVQAEEDAKSLVEKFPGSQLKAQALGILTSAAWARGYYRNAADFATKAREELRLPSDRPVRANLGLLIAEAYFRAEDYRNAADAYNAVLVERPEGVEAGGLMFQRVLAEIKAAGTDGQRLHAVEPLLDELARDPAFDTVSRWKAEWNLAQALLVAGDEATTLAYTRVKNLLAAPVAAAAGAPAVTVPPELRARMEWLRVRLSYEAGESEQTLRFADGLITGLAGLEPTLRDEIVSSVSLLKAQANFALGREAAAVEALTRLRADFPGRNATINSYFVEADYNEKQDKTTIAQQLLNKVADDFPKSIYAPNALYRVALLEERRGQDANLKEANSRFEKLIETYPQSELVFYARFEQGEILRRRNEFPVAQRTYEAIINAFPQHLWIEEVRLALAACHAEQAAGDESHADRAKEGFDRLLALPTASIDLRVEAGFNLGNILLQHPDARKVEDVWWRGVVYPFLIEKPELAARLGAKGRYWMSRTLLELGELFKNQGNLDEARRVWNLIIEKQLPMAGTARDKLGLKAANSAP